MTFASVAHATFASNPNIPIKVLSKAFNIPPQSGENRREFCPSQNTLRNSIMIVGRLHILFLFSYHIRNIIHIVLNNVYMLKHHTYIIDMQSL